MPTISVIVPVYKVEPYLRQCVDSILKQTYTDFELILVDDGSPDNCGQICDEYAEKDKRVHVIHQSNGGLSAARNAGIDWVFANSNSEWISFVDSDDVVHECYLERLNEIAHEYHADVSSCKPKEFSKVLQIELDDIENNTVFEYNSKDACRDIYDDLSQIRITAWGKLIRKDVLKNIRFPVGKVHEDQAVVPIVLYQAERVAAAQCKLYGYRSRPESITHENFSNRRFDDLDAVDKCIAFFKAHNEDAIVELAQRRKKILKANYNLFAIADGVHKDIPKQYRMSQFAAIKYLRETLSDSLYTYQLAKVHPKWIRPHEYIRKIKKTLHIPCK